MITKSRNFYQKKAKFAQRLGASPGFWGSSRLLVVNLMSPSFWGSSLLPPEAKGGWQWDRPPDPRYDIGYIQPCGKHNTVRRGYFEQVLRCFSVCRKYHSYNYRILFLLLRLGLYLCNQVFKSFFYLCTCHGHFILIFDDAALQGLL